MDLPNNLTIMTTAALSVAVGAQTMVSCPGLPNPRELDCCTLFPVAAAGLLTGIAANCKFPQTFRGLCIHLPCSANGQTDSHNASNYTGFRPDDYSPPGTGSCSLPGVPVCCDALVSVPSTRLLIFVARSPLRYVQLELQDAEAQYPALGALVQELKLTGNVGVGCHGVTSPTLPSVVPAV